MSKLSEAYKSLPADNPSDIIPIDFSSTPKLPDSYAWSQPSGDAEIIDASSTIPMIDLMDPNAMEQIGIACEKWGAFQVKNHGIPIDVIEAAEEETKRFFNLPTEEKVKVLRSPGVVTGYGRSRISPYFSKLCWNEGLTILGSASDLAKKIWPNDYERFCKVIENFEKEMKIVGERLALMVLKYLEMSEERRKWVGESNVTSLVHLNFYPVCPDPNQAMGLGPHTDASFFNILHQTQTNTDGGLQMFNEEKGWVPVYPHPNTLVVNVGDFLHIISNARYKCVLHRATVNKTQNRYSQVYVYSPPMDYSLSPVLGKDPRYSTPRFRDVTGKEYIEIKSKNSGDGLSFISAT